MTKLTECELLQIIFVVCEFTFCYIYEYCYSIYTHSGLGPGVSDPRQIVRYDR